VVEHEEPGACGLANICNFGSPLSMGISARSLTEVRCGSTPLANLFDAIFLFVILWPGSNFVAHIPIPALAPGGTAWMGLRLLDRPGAGHSHRVLTLRRT
jgi:SulP family sulfate permease